MNQLSYKRPPITEAIIEIRFSPIVEASELKKLSKKFNVNYHNIQPLESISVKFNIKNGESVADPSVEIDYRLSSKDVSEIAVLRKSSFLISQLAPYKSWSDLILRFERDWTMHEKLVGRRDIERIGVRYVNRIDIPVQNGSIVHEDEYLNIYPKLPDVLSPFSRYAIQSRTELKDIKSILTINSAVVPSPLQNCLSIVLDQDIGREVDQPQSTEDVIIFLNEVRIKKNMVFESCITDKSRELFNK